MTFIKFFELQVFETLLANSPMGLYELDQALPRAGTARGSGGFTPQRERGRPGSDRQRFCLIS